MVKEATIGPDIDLQWWEGLAPYTPILEAMEARAAAIRVGAAREAIWFLEHPPLFTAGTSSAPADLFNPFGFPVFEAGRGGQYTYHGPGQRVCYVMLDLQKRGRDLRNFVCQMENVVITALAELGVAADRLKPHVGVWVARPGSGGAGKDKIAAIGVRVRRWVSLHGFALNVDPDLAHFSGIVPCGIREPGLGVTSLRALRVEADMATVDQRLVQAMTRIWGANAEANRCAAGGS